MARSIIKQTKADAFRIERKTPYSKDYTTTAYGDAKTEADNWLAYHNLVQCTQA